MLFILVINKIFDTLYDTYKKLLQLINYINHNHESVTLKKHKHASFHYIIILKQTDVIQFVVP